MKRNKTLLISPSLFSLFLFFLINKNWRDADYILQDRIPRPIINKLRALGIKVTYIRSGNSFGSSVFGQIVRGLIINAEYIRFLFVKANPRKYAEVYGNDEMIQAIPFRESGISLIEDGSFNAQSKAFFETRVKKIHRFLLTRIICPRKICSYVPYGYSNHVSRIFLTQENAIDALINHKVKYISLSKSWAEKTSQEKSFITEIFGVSKDTLDAFGNYPNVLLTQPLCRNEGGLMSEKEKVALYKKLVEDIPTSQLLIKTHYAEKTNYRKYFKGSLVIDQPIPFQLFELFNFAPKKVITVSSSAALRYKGTNTEIMFAGTQIDPRIVKMYGIVNF